MPLTFSCNHGANPLFDRTVPLASVKQIQIIYVTAIAALILDLTANKNVIQSCSARIKLVQIEMIR